MSFQWLEMRITEEKERRQREAQILEQLPHALDEVHRHLAACLEEYSAAFGPESAEIHISPARVRITIREQQDGKWDQRARVEISTTSTPPGFRIERQGGDLLLIEVGTLPGDKLYYRDGDQFLTMEELTRRILDRAFFPKLGE